MEGAQKAAGKYCGPICAKIGVTDDCLHKFAKTIGDYILMKPVAHFVPPFPYMIMLCTAFVGIGGALIPGCIPACALFVGFFLSKVTPPISIWFSLFKVTVLHVSTNVFVSGTRVRLPIPHCGHAKHTFNPKMKNWNTSWLSGVIAA